MAGIKEELKQFCPRIEFDNVSLGEYRLPEAAKTKANEPFAMRQVAGAKCCSGSFTTDSFSTRADRCP